MFANSASKYSPVSSSYNLMVPFLVLAIGNPSWLANNLTSGVSCSVFENAPGAILSINGSGNDASLNTAAYPAIRIVPSSASRVSMFLTVKVRRSVFFILLLALLFVELISSISSLPHHCKQPVDLLDQPTRPAVIVLKAILCDLGLSDLASWPHHLDCIQPGPR